MPDKDDKAEKREARYRLHDLKVNEVSFVGRGDNPGAKIMLVKNHDDEGTPDVEIELNETDPTLIDKVRAFFTRKNMHPGDASVVRTTEEVLARDEFMSKFITLKLAFRESVQSIFDLSPSEEMFAALQKSVEEFSNRARELAKPVGKGYRTSQDELDSLLSDLHKSVASAIADEDLDEFTALLSTLDNFELQATQIKQEGKMTGKAKTLEDVLKALPDDDKEIVKAAIVEVKPAEKDKEEIEKEQVAALPEAMQKRMNDLEAMAKLASEKADLLEKEKKQAEYLGKAKAMNIVGVEHAIVAKALEIADGAGDDGKAIESVMLACKEIAKHGKVLTESIGKQGGGEVKTAHDQVVAKALEFQKAEPKLSPEQAYVKALDANPSLYEEMNAARAQ